MAVRLSEYAGANFIQVKPPGKCRRCLCEVLPALYQYADKSLKWHNFARQPIERNGRRFYLRHACPR